MPAPGMPFPEGAASPRLPLSTPSARSASIPPRRLWEKRMAQSSRPGERAASGLGSRRLWEPLQKGYSWLFYKYIYIFFVARYCYLTLGLGLRGLLACPNQA